MTRPSPCPRPAPAEPTVDQQLAAFGRWVLAMHQPGPSDPHWCTCGQNVVLCPYRSAATRYLGPPGT